LCGVDGELGEWDAKDSPGYGIISCCWEVAWTGDELTGVCKYIGEGYEKKEF
jgi:hypothetical protein